MAKIQVDFDQVMHFADLHRDLAASLDSHRSVFNLDGNRLDQIINEFSLSRSTSNPHFSGQTVAWSLLDASDRAQRVAHSMMETSTRIFQQANPIVDDHFDWGHSLYNALNGANLTAPKNALLEFVGGKLVDVIVVAGRYGVLATPAFIIVAPVFLLVTGGLTLYEGVQQVLDVASDAWDRVSGGLKILAGGATIVVGGVVGAMLITAGTATAAATAILLAPVLVVAAVIGVVALAIDHRNEIGNLLGFGPTLAETNNDQLVDVPKTWTIPLGPSTGPILIADFGPATSPGLSVGTAAGRTVLQGNSGIRLQGPTPAQPQATQDSGGRSVPPVAVIEGPQQFANSAVADMAETEIGLDDLKDNRYHGQGGTNLPGACMVAASRWLKQAGGNWPGGLSDPLVSYRTAGAASVAVGDAQRGDFLQKSIPGDTTWEKVHTVVVLKNNGDGTFTIAESNWNWNGDSRIVEGWTPANDVDATWTAWRFGQVN